MRFPLLRTPLLTSVLCLALAGCAGLRPEPLDVGEVPVPPAFSQAGRQPLPDRWWRHFNDPRLDALVGQALGENFSLAAARDRLRQAEAAARVSGAARRPRVDLRAEAGTRRASGAARSEEWSLGPAASYELDLWGRLSSAARAAALDAQATGAELDAAAISLSAETARAYYELLHQQGTGELLRSQRDTSRRVLELVELRFRNGRASADEVLRQRQLIDQTEAALVRVEAATELLNHRLAVLLGRPPRSLSVAADAAVVEVPPLPAAGLPSEWLQRRPDLREAFLRLRAADARLAAAVADQYPRIDLSASIQSAAGSPGGLFSGWLGSLAASLAAPLFDGGRRRAEVERTEAARAAALNDYGQAVLTALREVEDALAAERRDRALLETLTAQSARAERIVEQLRLRYLNGSVSYLDVLDALASQQQLARDLLAARWALVQDRIELARALAGGWDARIEPQPLLQRDEQDHVRR